MDQDNQYKVLLICGTGALMLNILYGLKMAGVQVHAAGAAESSLRWSRICDAFHAVPIYLAEDDPDAYCAELNALQAREHFDCLVTGAGGSILYDLLDRINIPHFPVPSAATRKLLDNKWYFHQTCEKLGVPVPATQGFADKDDLQRNWTFAGTPVVVKPACEGFNAGIVFAHTEQDLIEHIYDNPHYTFQPLLVQDYIAGYDIDVSILANKGEVVKAAVQKRDGQDIVFLQNDDLVDQVRKIARATHYHGVAHFDARIADRGGALYLIECNPRFWGSMNASLFCGVNFVAEGLRMVFDLEPSDDEIKIGARYTSPLTALRKMSGMNFDGLKPDAHMWSGLRQLLVDPLPHLQVNGKHALTKTQSVLRSVVPFSR